MHDSQDPVICSAPGSSTSVDFAVLPLSSGTVHGAARLRQEVVEAGETAFWARGSVSEQGVRKLSVCISGSREGIFRE